ncbi:MAG: FAD binding domain-containing protein [Thermoplasmata archaeon]|nr:FAD binding domain-containing protein [Thermoplasmata archaeon]
MQLLAPTRAEEAIAALLDGPEGRVAVLAGGTDLLLDLDEGKSSPEVLLSLHRLPWRELTWEAERLEIGATLPLAQLEQDPELARRIPGLHEAVGAIGGVALRHQATLGGNLVRASPVSDLIPILLALECEVGLLGSGGERSLPLEQFLLGPRRTALQRGELVRRVWVPALPSAFRWQRVRPANDVSQISVAVAFAPKEERWRIATAGVAPLARRAKAAEAILRGPSPGEEAIAAAGASAAEEAEVRQDRRATDAYRRHLLRTLVLRAIRAVATGVGGQPA